MIENKTSKKGGPQEIKPQKEAQEPTFVPSEISSEPILEKLPAQSVDTETSEDLESAVADEWLDPQLHIGELEENVADLNDKLLRALAETENVRRRAQRDKEDASKYGIRRFAEDMLQVSDNLGRALSSIEPETRKADSNLNSIATGIEIVMKELLVAFEQSGVKPIDAMGVRFDPMLHEAMFEIEDLDQPAGTIAQVMEDGYTLHGRTLRAAKVGVTKGGPRTTAPKEGEMETEKPVEPPGKHEGQQTYEAQGETVSEAGSRVDQEL